MSESEWRALGCKWLARMAVAVAIGASVFSVIIFGQFKERDIKLDAANVALAATDVLIATEREQFSVEIQRIKDQLKILRQHKEIIEASDTVFAIIDANGQVRAWSGGAIKLFNLTREQAYELDLAPLIPTALRPLDETQLRQAMKDGRLPGAKYQVTDTGSLPSPLDVTLKPLPGGEVIPTYVVQVGTPAAKEEVKEAVQEVKEEKAEEKAAEEKAAEEKAAEEKAAEEKAAEEKAAEK